MPDWSYHPLNNFILKRLKPKTSREFIHRSMSLIASIPGGKSFIEFLGHMDPPKELHRKIGDSHFRSPVGLSSLIDPELTGFKAFQQLGFGFLEIGPIVLKDDIRKSQEPKRIEGSLQFPVDGEKVYLRRAIQRLSKHDSNIPTLARIDESVNEVEWQTIINHLTPFVDGFVITETQFIKFIKGQDTEYCRPFYLSTFTENDFNQLLDNRVVGLIVSAPRQVKDGFWQECKDANERLLKKVSDLKKHFPELALITSGGVQTPEDAKRLFDAGAHLMMLTSGYVQSGPGLPKRINERMLYDEHKQANTVIKNQWHWSFLFGLSILFGGLIALYFAFTSIILPYDESFIGLRRSEIYGINPLILSFMSHDRMALAGTMISGGILYIQLARNGIRNGLHFAKVAFHTAAIIGFLGILLFIGYGYFDWLHGLFWLILLPIYLLSIKESKTATHSPKSSHGTNDKSFRKGLVGQLMFILLGFMLIIGGLVITTIGVTNVFVSTDLSFICMTPEMLSNISDRLIPVIAHDRAGFGGALISVGLLVLMVSLWGFRYREKWVWNTIAIGAIPAFAAGIGTHFYIGYTTFIHLLPVYFLVLLYILGLVLSYSFLKGKNEKANTYD